MQATQLIDEDPEPAVASTERVVDYATLDGARGRDVNFRPERYHASELGPVGIDVTLRMGASQHRCELHDVSQNGVAFEWPDAVPVEIGATLDEIAIRFDEHEAYRGEARVGSIRRSGDKTIVGASFVETLMNIEDVLQLRDVKAWHAGSGTTDLGLSNPVWRAPGNERFKALVAELRLLLEDVEPRLSELERSLPWHVAHGEHDSPARDALVARIKKEVVVELVHASEEIDAALRTSSTADRQALKEYSHRQLHALMMQSPWMHRANAKPLGYPGDYEVMNGLYSSHFAGATLFAKAINTWAVSTGAAAAVRARKDLLRTELGRAVDAGEPSVRILSIAAGPAQEIYELLEERATIARPIEIVLFDQDKRALAFSYGRLKRLLSAKRHDAVQVTHLHDSIKRLLRDGRLFESYGKFDVIYCSGLFDYLQLPTAVHLCRNLFRNLALGGRLYVGNMVPANPSRWIMEFHLDWFLHYRERSELVDLARMAVPEAEVELLEEVVGVNPFVSMRRS